MLIRVSATGTLTTLQFSMVWDPRLLRLRSTDRYGLRGMDEESFGLLRAAQGQLAFGWNDPEWSGLEAVEDLPACGSIESCSETSPSDERPRQGDARRKRRTILLATD